MANARIMIVEDEYILAKGLKTQLENMGYAVTGHLSSGDEALAGAEKDRPDLVLMDIVMPGTKDGIEAAREIHEKLDIPVVFLTAYSDTETIARAKTTEPFGYVTKPFDEKDLYIAIEMALNKDRLEKDPKRSWKKPAKSAVAEDWDLDV